MEFVVKIVSVAVGGACGAVARYLINVSPLAAIFAKFPLPTFFINVVGSFLVGFLVVLLADKLIVSENLRLALIVGFLGAFTTFSTFELELFELSKEREYVIALIYLIVSILIGFVGIISGVMLAKRL